MKYLIHKHNDIRRGALAWHLQDHSGSWYSTVECLGSSSSGSAEAYSFLLMLTLAGRNIQAEIFRSLCKTQIQLMTTAFSSVQPQQWALRGVTHKLRALCYLTRSASQIYIYIF